MYFAESLGHLRRDDYTTDAFLRWNEATRRTLRAVFVHLAVLSTTAAQSMRRFQRWKCTRRTQPALGPFFAICLANKLLEVRTLMAEGAPYWMLWEELVVGGAHWSALLRRGTTLRLTDVAGGANASVLLYNYEDRAERYNMPDTLKAQHTAFLKRGDVCYSDMGRVMCSITDDTCGWHDALSGLSSPTQVTERFGASGFAERRNDYIKNGYESVLNELGKYDLGKRDLTSSINFFSKVTVDDDGALHYQRGHSAPGAYVDLRFEMNVLIVLATCQHPLDPAVAYQPRDIRLTAWHSRPAPRNDPCRTRCPENERGFRNTEIWFR